MMQLHPGVTLQLLVVKGEVDKDSSYAPSDSASTACSEELPKVQSICFDRVRTAVSREVGANSSTQPTEMSTSVKGREDAAKAKQSP